MRPPLPALVQLGQGKTADSHGAHTHLDKAHYNGEHAAGPGRCAAGTALTPERGGAHLQPLCAAWPVQKAGLRDGVRQPQTTGACTTSRSSPTGKPALWAGAMWATMSLAPPTACCLLLIWMYWSSAPWCETLSFCHRWAARLCGFVQFRPTLHAPEHRDGPADRHPHAGARHSPHLDKTHAPRAYHVTLGEDGRLRLAQRGRQPARPSTTPNPTPRFVTHAGCCVYWACLPMEWLLQSITLKKK